MPGTRLNIHNVVICDDVRRELTGKDILIGVYGGSIVVPSLPAMMSIAVWLQITPTESGELPLKFRWLNPQGVELSKLETKATISDTTLAAFTIPGMPMQLQSPGDIKFEIKQGDDEWETAYTISVQVGKVG